MESRRGSQRDFHGVKIFNDGTIFALIVALVFEKNFVVGKFTVEDVAAMSFVDNYQVKVRHAWRSVFVVKNSFDHALNSRDLQTCFLAESFIAEFVDVVDFIWRQQVFELDGGENVLSLVAE